MSILPKVLEITQTKDVPKGYFDSHKMGQEFMLERCQEALDNAIEKACDVNVLLKIAQENSRNLSLIAIAISTHIKKCFEVDKYFHGDCRP